MIKPVKLSLSEIFMFGMAKVVKYRNSDNGGFEAKTYSLATCVKVASLNGYSDKEIGTYIAKKATEVSRFKKLANESKVDEMMSSLIYLKNKKL